MLYFVLYDAKLWCCNLSGGLTVDDVEGGVESAEAGGDCAGAAAEVQQDAAGRDARRRLRDEALQLRATTRERRRRCAQLLCGRADAFSVRPPRARPPRARFASRSGVDKCCRRLRITHMAGAWVRALVVRCSENIDAVFLWKHATRRHSSMMQLWR